MGKSYVNLAAKLGLAYTAIRRLSGLIASCISKSNEYIEAVNLFRVSMGEYAEEAQAYAEKVSEVMGIDPAEWMKNQGSLMAIIKGFGVAGDKAYLMSKSLTQLSYDLSSFENSSFEEAFLKIQAGISGELEPLRRYGFDLSAARLQQEALNLGITKSVSAMNQAEKAELRHYAVMTQLTYAQGDMARTIDAPANQLRILSEQIKQCARAIGNIFLPILTKVLPYLTAVANVVRTVADELARLFGFKLPEMNWDSVNDAAVGVGDLTDGLGDAAENAKELKNSLLGIDEINRLSDGSGAESGAGSGSGTGSDLGVPILDYDFIGEAVRNQINGITEGLKEFLGLSEGIGDPFAGAEKWFKPFKAAWEEDGSATVDAAKRALEGVSGLLSSIGQDFSIVWQSTAGQQSLETIFGLFREILKLAGTLSASLQIAWETNGNGQTILFNIFGIFNTILGTVSDIVGATAEWAGETDFTPLMESVADLTGELQKLSDLLGDTLKWGYENVLLPLATWAVEELALASLDLLTGALEALRKLLSPLADGIKSLWEAVEPVVRWVEETVIDVIGALRDIFKELADVFDEKGEDITGILDDIGWAISSLWTLAEPYFTYFRNGVSNVIGFVGRIVGQGVSGMISSLRSILRFIRSVFTGDWEEAWGAVTSFFTEKWDGVKESFKATGNFLIGIVENFVNFFIRGINFIIRGLNKISFDVPDWLADLTGMDTFGFDLSEAAEIDLPRLADGGLVPAGQMFIARERGPELVGQIGRQTAVMNNEQIVDSVAQGVADANAEQNALLREEIALLRRIAESGAYPTAAPAGGISVKEIARLNRRAGKQVIMLGV